MRSLALNVKWPLIQCNEGTRCFPAIRRSTCNYKSILFSGAIVKSLEIFFLAQRVSKISIPWSTPARWHAAAPAWGFVCSNPTELKRPNQPYASDDDCLTRE
ncbi:hypothetical protein XCCB100_3172 [Xanthomonas campestris pv. campestris]|uniref:Uncharacterized protein n=1 Tax=Xanthomonas campestris pv. campestris (strain B100) TaxID=509169 RepID=B0RY17_XANCB|nr:hypothetical protein XCCB100_3172 [Xanthomonas campestris pv. campestris]